MKKRAMVRSKKYGPLKKSLLVLCLIGISLALALLLASVYQKIQVSLGADAAQVSLIFYMPELLILTIIGMGLGLLGDWAIRKQKSIFHDPKEGSFVEMLVRFWGYEMVELEDVDPQIVPDIRPAPFFEEDVEEIHQPRRRGRKPTFPLEAWLPIAAKWENRDPIRDAFTLEDLIRDSLGTNPDGSPVVSAQSYYTTWRERALKELAKREKAKKAARQSPPDKPPQA